MATPTMTIQLEAAVNGSATGWLTLVASTEGQAVAHATASGLSIAGTRKDKARPTRTATSSTTNLSTTVTSTTAAFTSDDIGRGISGTGIPANTTITAVASATSATMSAAATATGTPTITLGTAGLLVFTGLNPNSGSSDDVIDDPTGTVWRLVIKPNASSETNAPIYFTAPDTAGTFLISDYLTTEPSAMPPAGATNAVLDGDVIDTVGNNRLRDLVESAIRGQGDQLPRFTAMLPTGTTERVDVLVPGDSMTRHMWSWASAGTNIEWLQLITRMTRALGIPSTSDVRLGYQAAINAQSVWYSTTGSVAAGTHGFAKSGITLSSGATWSTTFGGATEATWDEVPGDGADVYVTMVPSGGGSIQVLLDDVEVLAATTTNDATPGATLGHRLIYSTGLLDGAAHTLKVVASGGSVKLDLVLVHHGTLTVADEVAGVVWWNGGLNGSSPSTHLGATGFADTLDVLADTLALVMIPTGIVTYISDTTGATYVSEVTDMVEAVQAATAADVLIGHQPEFAGFDLTGTGTLSTGSVWAGWRDTTEALAVTMAETLGAALVRLAGPLGTEAGVALNSGGLDVFTQTSPLSGNDLVHVNQYGHNVYANEFARVLFGGRRALGAPATGGGGSGDVTGPGSSVDDRVATWNGTGGDTLQDGGKTVAELLARANHTGTQSFSTIVEGVMSGFSAGTGRIEINNIVGAPTFSIYANGTDANPIMVLIGTMALGSPILTGPGGGTAVSVAHLFNSIKQAATTTATGVSELATDAEAQAKSDTARTITPSNLAALGSSTTFAGLVELATSAETITGTDTVRAVTPAGGAAAYQPLDSDLTAIAALSTTPFGRALLALADAAALRTAGGLGSLATLSTITTSEITDGTIVNGDINASAAIAGTKVDAGTDTVRGTLELATNAETLTGTDTARAITPANLLAAQTARRPIVTFPAASGQYYNMGVTNTGTVGNINASGRLVLGLLYLPARTYDRVGVVSTVAAVATWRVGWYPLDSNGMPDWANAFDAGTLDMNATAGAQLITISRAQSSAGWVWAGILTDAYTANPSVQFYGSVSNGSVHVPGVNVGGTSNLNAVGMRWSGVSTGAMPTSNPGTPVGNEQVPRIVTRTSN